MRRFTRLAPSDAPTAQTGSTFRFAFSDESVGRDQHVVLNSGIQTANYLRNPVILWAHDDNQPPIGRGSNIDTAGFKCRIDVTFMDKAVSPFAAMIADMVRGKWLRALSMSWQPLEWRYSTDKSRPSGIDFIKVDLLEISVVPLPALPDALLDARSYGVDTQPLHRWAGRALDMRSYHGVPRSQLEAIYSAARTRPTTRADRLRTLRELRTRGCRLQRASQLRDRIEREDSDARRAHHDAVRRGQSW
jgi:hypothetical protein